MPPIDLELPVDPNEPTYCLCNQVSYGEMVACDNPNVGNTFFVSLLYSSLMCYIFRTRAWFNLTFLTFLAVQDRMVSLRLRGRQGSAQGKVVLPELHRIPEEAKRQVICNPHATPLVCRPCLLNVVDVGYQI